MNGNTKQSAGRHFGEYAFKWLTLVMASVVFALIALIGFELFRGSHLALQKFGWHFLASSDWDPVNDVYGALPFIFGTIVSSILALLIAYFLTRIFTRRVRSIQNFARCNAKNECRSNREEQRSSNGDPNLATLSHCANAPHAQNSSARRRGRHTFSACRDAPVPASDLQLTG